MIGAASFHCLVDEWKDCEELKPKPKEKWIFVDQKREETKHRTEWCAEAEEYRCIRCGRGSKYMKTPGKCTGPKYLSCRQGCKAEEGWTGRQFRLKLEEQKLLATPETITHHSPQGDATFSSVDSMRSPSHGPPL